MVIAPDRSVTLSWSHVLNAEKYDVQVYPTGTPSGQECTAPNTFCSEGISDTSFTFIAPLGVPEYTWRIQATNEVCNPTSGGWITGTFRLVGSLAGTIYLDDTSTAVLNLGTGLCDRVGLLPQSPGSASITASWLGAGSPQIGTVNDANYSLSGIPNFTSIGLTLTPRSEPVEMYLSGWMQLWWTHFAEQQYSVLHLAISTSMVANSRWSRLCRQY
ncbi:hypothetical protein HC928_12350 [bacterium]|nr:hypothetical protein [bacterium]